MERRGGAARRGGRGGHDDANVRISKKLAFILRHGAEREGIEIGSDGFVLLDDLLSRKDFSGISVEDVERIVRDNDKKRFELETRFDETIKVNIRYIRAAQGHTIKAVSDEDLLTKISEDVAATLSVVVHGTFKQFWESISKEGLKRMARNHIHFSIGYLGEKEVISGMRNTCDVFIEIDIVNAIKDGIPFYMSSNNVILTPGIEPNGLLPLKYFKIVKDKHGNQLKVV